MHVRVELVLRLDVEDAALAARVGRFQDGRQPDGLERGPRAQHVAGAREAGLRHAGVGERAPHRDLVRHQMGGLGPDPGQSQRLGDGSDDRHSPVGRDGQHSVDAVPACDVRDCSDVGEIDRLARVRGGEARRVRVPVDGDGAQAELLRAQDGAALVASRAHEENRLHVARDAIRVVGTRWERPAPLRLRVGAGGEAREEERQLASRARSDSRWSPRTSPRPSAPRASR